MLKSQDQRQSHLDLNQDCIEIGGDSRIFRGLLAHHLGTTIPTGHKILLCHACHNAKCSNPQHLYWGTAKENVQDNIENGKHHKPHAWTSKASSLGGKAGGGHNKFSDDEIGYRISIIESCEPLKFGWISRAQKKLGISHTQIRRFVEEHNIETYKRV